MPVSLLSIRSLLTLSLAFVLTLAACDRGAPEPAQESSAAATAALPSGTIDRSFAGESMPAIAVVDPAGRTLDAAAIRGKPVLVNLWATWCAPCIKEMPLLDALADDYGADLRVITVSQDMDGADKVVPFFAEREFRNLEPWLDPDNALGFSLGGATLPTTVLYDAEGEEVWRVIGDFDWSSAAARSAIDEAINS